MTSSKKTGSTLLEIPSVYGTISINDPLMHDLILSPAFQRLKEIHQYGVVHFIMPTESYYRFDHSLGVYFLLKKIGAAYDEQISGLLHDVSHTVFSHVGDYVFRNHSNEGSYQDDIHLWFLKESGLEEILKKHGLTSDRIYHRRPEFIALDRPLPQLCADRFEYNIQGGLLRNLINQEEFNAILEHLTYEEGKWIIGDLHLAEKLGNCSLVMTETLWGSAWEALVYRYAADALKRAFAINLISFHEFHFSTDTLVWNKLKHANDPYIMACIEKMEKIKEHYTLVAPGQEDLLLKLKFRGVDPWVKCQGGLFPLTEKSRAYACNYQNVNKTMAAGWPIKFR
jgi:uncharacterized protein